MTRRRIAVAGALVLVGVVVGAVLMAVLGNRPDRDPGSAVDAGPLALSPEGMELVSLLRRGEEATYHARYRATSDEQRGGSALTILLWRKPPLARQDLIVSASGRTARSAGFLLEDGPVTCLRDAAGPWSCRRLPGAGPQGPQALIEEITEQVEAGPIRARDATVAGATVRCFTLPLSGGTGEVCLTESGIPARISAEASRIELVEVAETVPGSVFTLPASPAG